MKTNKKSLFVAKKPHKFRLFLVLAALLLIVLMAILENNRLTVDHQAIALPSLPPDFQGMQVLLISDLNGRRFGEKQEALISKIQSTKCDIVLISGNMISPTGDAQPFYELLDGLSDLPVYFVLSDTDPVPIEYDEATNTICYSDYVQGAINRGAHYLELPVKLERSASSIWLFPGTTAITDTRMSIAALEVQRERDDLSNGDRMMLDYHQHQMEQLAQIQAQLKTEDTRIAFFHRPLVPGEDLFSGQNPFAEATDLALAGYYTGGTWRIPLLGAPHVNTPALGWKGWFPPQQYISGQMQVDGVLQYVTTGLGVHFRPTWCAFRLFNPPQISLLQLTNHWSDGLSQNP